MKAIVYLSNSGYTKEYAEIIGEKCNIPAYTWKESLQKLKHGDEVVYMGWVMATSIKGFNKADSRYEIQAVSAVGMMQTDEQNIENLKNRHHITSVPFFYLQGGFDIKRLKGIYRWIMTRMSKSMIAQLKQIEEPSEDEKKLISMMESGGTCVCEKNAQELIDWINANKSENA